ncbi:MAG: cyclic nucleotide-binding domain-containing protein [Thermoplasmata archaeon]|nr:cyclic nucleotide-binding domain-containing protein [Thermoplasmata archaeon]
MSDAKGAGPALAMLGSVPLFSGLGKSQLRTMVTSAKERTYRAGETIVKQGEKGIGFYLILDGQARVEKAGQQVAVLGPGQFFGEMALLDQQPRTADVLASGAVRCLVLSPWEFWSAVGNEPEVLRTLLKETVRRMRSGPAALSD